MLKYISVFLFVGILANADNTKPVIKPADLENNPYVQLYKLRVDEADSNLHRAQAISDLAQAKFQRTAHLLQQAAASKEDYDVDFSAKQVADADVVLAGKKLDEAKAFLQIVMVIVPLKGGIPLCAYGMD